MIKIILLFLLLIPFQLDARVFARNQWIDFYLRDCNTIKPYRACKQNLEKALGKMIQYRSMTFRYLDKEQLPKWFIVIPIVESNYNKKATSPKGALGLWQLMPYNIAMYQTKKIVILNYKIIPTTEKIKKYGFDPESNTKMAVLHFRKLFERYRDHKNAEQLAIMAYNCGESWVNSWLLGKSKLPDETQNYYNKIMAVKYIIRNMNRLGVEPVRKLTIVEKIKGLL